MPSRTLAQSSPQPSRLTVRRKLLYSVLVVLLFFALLEIVFRVVGIGKPPIVGALRFGYDTGIPRFDADGVEVEGRVFQDYPLFEADRSLFWKPVADTPFTGPQGLRLPVPGDRRKATGVLRFAVIGDSCSFLGRELYPERFAKLAAREGLQQLETINASCPGYTSFQGLRRLQDVWPWEPDWLIVYFGWNDHWNSLTGKTDRELAALRVFDPLHIGLQQFHSYWVLARLISPPAAPASAVRRTVRVPLDDYRRNLEAIAAEARDHHCRLLLVTAPTCFVESELPEWAFSFFGDYYEMSRSEVENIPQTHREYNEVLKQVAAECDAWVLDLAAAWPPEESKPRFRSDCIHLTEQGHAEAATELWNLWKQAESAANR